MTFNEPQLKLISDKLKYFSEAFQKAEGFGSLCAYADLSIWVSHANLAGYNVEKDTGKMYRQKDNVRTYYVPKPNE